MAGNGKDHWLWNTRADDTGSIVEGYSLVYSIGGSEAYLWPPARLLNFTIARASTYFSASRRYGVTITGLLVTVYPAGHPRYGDARATHSSKSQLSSLLKCLHVHISFFMANTIHG